VSNRFLFARGPEEKLRRFLIDADRVQAVIAFPSGLLSTTYVPFALLVLGKRDRQRQTIFCRVDEARHMSAAAGKLRTHDRRFIGHDEVLAALTSPIAPWSRAVSREAIEERDYMLSVERYLNTDAEAAVERAAGNRDTVPLGDLVTIVKPQALPSIDGRQAVPVFKVGPSELPDISGRSRWNSPTCSTSVCVAGMSPVITQRR
jgi:type I restriction enzyme M protein